MEFTFALGVNTTAQLVDTQNSEPSPPPSQGESMRTDEIVKLSKSVINDLINKRRKSDSDYEGSERRRAIRWPFPGPVEVRPDGGDGLIQWFGTCVNLSESGLGFTCDEHIEPGSVLEVAFHYPERSVYGRGIARYCMGTPEGYLIGLEFIFEDED